MKDKTLGFKNISFLKEMEVKTKNEIIETGQSGVHM
jgi:hypothetical protein